VQSRTIGRILALIAVVVAVGAVAVVLFGSGGTDYTIHARFQTASQLVKGNLVQVAGVPIGTVKKLDLTPDGQADVTLHITDGDFAPLRKGTLATVRQSSLSGVANRYVDLRLPDGRSQQTIPDGGVLPASDTTSAVDLDQLFDTFDPKTAKALQGVIQGYATAYGGRAEQANAGFLYLNPSLAATSRLFEELNYDTPTLKRFIDSSSKLVTNLAARRNDIAGLIDHLGSTAGAIGDNKAALASAVSQLPQFMRRANSTFVNLRATLDDLDPLVKDSKPAAKALKPVIAQLRPLARDAAPTIRDLSKLVRSPGKDNDLYELTKSTIALRPIAVGPVTRNGKEREGALPASAKALGESAPELEFARPYAVDLTGWFDDFGHSGIFDALGGASRAALNVNAFANLNGVLSPILSPVLQVTGLNKIITLGQTNRCPGSMERGSVWKPTPNYNCDETQVPPGP
jgi:phospholipid/cholesterol/gamma-HCH transport system substrate-binding protein